MLVLHSRNNHCRCWQVPRILCSMPGCVCALRYWSSLLWSVLFYPDFQCLQVMMEEENDGIKVDNCLLVLKNNSNLIMKYLEILLLAFKKT